MIASIFFSFSFLLECELAFFANISWKRASIARIENDCAQLRPVRLQSPSSADEAQHLPPAISIPKLCDTSRSSSTGAWNGSWIAGAACERAGSHGAELRRSRRADPHLEDAGRVLRDSQGAKGAAKREFAWADGLKTAGPNTECQEEDISVDAVHWKVGKGAHRDAAGGDEAEPGSEAEYLDGCAAGDARVAGGFVRFVAGAAGG